jgi:uncharacterized protein YjcR
MNEKERQRQMDFILNQQAQFAADIQKLQEAQAEMAQVVNRLAAVTVEGFKQTNAKIDTLIDAQTRTEGALTRLAESQTQLAEAQTHTDQRLDALIDIIREGRNGKSS